jgi:hypothetical protein
MGGHLITVVLRDGRPGRGDRLITLEMKWLRRIGWFPLKRELTTAEAAAVCGVAASTFYRLAGSLLSKKKVFGQSFFDTRKLFEEMAVVDELAARVEATKGGRPGAHAAHCPDPVHGRGRCPHATSCRADESHRDACREGHTSYCRAGGHDGRCAHARYCKANVNHDGTCKDANDPRRRRRAQPASPGWSKQSRPARGSSSAGCTPAVPAAPTPKLGRPRQTWTEAAINESTGDPPKRAALYAEYRADIEEERAAGSFVPQGHEIA